VEWHVAAITKARTLSPLQAQAQTRNRRQKYLQDKLNGSEYFDEDAIRRREPEVLKLGEGDKSSAILIEYSSIVIS